MANYIAELGMGITLIVGSGLLMAIGCEWSLWGVGGIICAGFGGSLIANAEARLKFRRDK